MKAFTFSKEKHLCGEIAIGELFNKGKAFIVYPLRIVYLHKSNSETNPPCKVLVTAPKKRFKRAVDRNRIKRLIRESYRLNQQTIHEFCVENEITIELAFAYVADEIYSFEQIQSKLTTALEKIQTHLEKKKL